MFDHLTEFCVNTLAVVSKGDTVIQLTAEDAAKLCGTTLCRPVQLQLHDGVSTEIVTFKECTGGIVAVERGDTPYKFLKGALLRFVWTAANVQAVTEGC